MIPVEPAPARTKGVLEARPHTEYGGVPFYDAELDVLQSKAHRIQVVDLAGILATVAADAGLAFLADEPIWYLHPETDEQRAYYGDCVLGEAADEGRVTAASLRLVLEVVTGRRS